MPFEARELKFDGYSYSMIESWIANGFVAVLYLYLCMYLLLINFMEGLVLMDCRVISFNGSGGLFTATRVNPQRLSPYSQRSKLAPDFPLKIFIFMVVTNKCLFDMFCLILVH